MVTEVESKARYIIPNNFIEGGKVFGGQFKLRNVIEGVILGGIVALFLLMLPIRGTAARISVTLSFSLPCVLLGVIGINDDPLSVFLSNVRNWRKSKKIMLYDNSTKVTTAQLVDMMLADVTPTEIMVKKVNKYLNERKKKDDGKPHIEGVDFVFAEDKDLTKFKTPEEQEESAKRRAAETIKKRSKTAKDTFVIDDSQIESIKEDEEGIKVGEELLAVEAAPIELSAEDLFEIGSDFEMPLEANESGAKKGDEQNG